MPTDYDHRLIIVVPASARSQANVKALEVDPDGGQLFGSPLVPAGSPPGTAPTHYWCSWQLTHGQFTGLSNRLDTPAFRTMGVRLFDAATWTPQAVLASLALEALPYRDIPRP